MTARIIGSIKELLDSVVSQVATASDAQLAQARLATAALREHLDQDIYACDQELLRRMRERGATELPLDGATVRLVRASPTYDLGLLTALKETLTAEWLNKVWTPAHEEMIQVAEKWNGTQLRSAEKLGGEVAAVIQQARIPGRESIVVEAKGEKP